ncbi:MAG TPA: IPT/TIG domain-containing protein [Candidatus Acidoferrum sp.]|nr:IPT/TIG domain-containing protein [Candidatus Acidoferrum sp.]
MKRSWAALAVAVIGFAGGAGCNDYGNTFQNNTGAFVSFLSPSQIPACVGSNCADVTLTLKGAGFVLKTVVQWNGKPLVTTVPVDSTGAALGNTVAAVIPAAMLAKPGTATVLTVNPASGAGQNGLSNTITFIIDNPANPLPTVTSVSPACAAPGADLPLTVTGTNFLTSSASSSQVSTLNWNFGGSQFQFTAPTATITATQITVTIPKADISAAGSASVTVFNPPSLPLANVSGSTGSGGGTSTASTVTIQSAPCPVAAKASAGAEASAIVAEETPAVSLDGRYVAYTAVQEDHAQIFLRDTCEGVTSGCQPRTTMLSVAADGTPANDNSHAPSMSSDGRYIAFSSAATNLVENAPPGRQVYLLDTCAGARDSCKPATHLISTDPNGALVGAESILPSVSSSGRFVAFLAITPSHSSNPASAQAKTSGGSNSGFRQVFIRDTCLGATNCTPKTTRISLQPGDATGSASPPAGPALSGSANHVAVAGSGTATLFTRSVAVDDRVFLAIANQKP